METNMPESPKSAPFSTLQKVIGVLLQYASIIEGLFTVPVSEEVASETWASIAANANPCTFELALVEPDQTMKEMDLHHLAAAVLLELKKLDGSLLTNGLHNRFIAAAAISNRYSQIYVFRLLLGNLPPPNYVVLKNLSLLLRCTIFKNTSNISEQVIVTFGRLLMRHREGVLYVHRQLTAADAGTLITVVLIEEWNYLFQYGRVSFHNSLAKGDTNPTCTLATGSLKSFESECSDANDVLGSNDWWKIPPSELEGSLHPATNQDSSIIDNNRFCEDLFGNKNLKIRPKASPDLVSVQQNVRSSESIEMCGKGCKLQSSVASIEKIGTTKDKLEKKEQEISCYGPSYWKHWFEESDMKFCKVIHKYALSRRLTKRKAIPPDTENSSKSHHEQEKIPMSNKQYYERQLLNPRETSRFVSKGGTLALQAWSMLSSSSAVGNILRKEKDCVSTGSNVDKGAARAYMCSANVESSQKEAVYFNQCGFPLACFSLFSSSKMGQQEDGSLAEGGNGVSIASCHTGSSTFKKLTCERAEYLCHDGKFQHLRSRPERAKLRDEVGNLNLLGRSDDPNVTCDEKSSKYGLSEQIFPSALSDINAGDRMEDHLFGKDGETTSASSHNGLISRSCSHPVNVLLTDGLAHTRLSGSGNQVDIQKGQHENIRIELEKIVSGANKSSESDRVNIRSEYSPLYDDGLLCQQNSELEIGRKQLSARDISEEFLDSYVSTTKKKKSHLPTPEGLNHPRDVFDIKFKVRKPKARPCEAVGSLGLSNDCLERMQKFVINVTQGKVVEETALKATVNQLLSADFGRSTMAGLVSEQLDLKKKGEQAQVSVSAMGNTFPSYFLPREEGVNTSEHHPTMFSTHRQDLTKLRDLNAKPQQRNLLRGSYTSENSQGLQFLLGSDELAGARGFHVSPKVGACLLSGGDGHFCENTEKKVFETLAKTCYSSINPLFQIFQTDLEQVTSRSSTSDASYQPGQEPSTSDNALPTSTVSLHGLQSLNQSICEEGLQPVCSTISATTEKNSTFPKLYIKVSAPSNPATCGSTQGLLDLCADNVSPSFVLVHPGSVLSAQNFSLKPATFVQVSEAMKEGTFCTMDPPVAHSQPSPTPCLPLPSQPPSLCLTPCVPSPPTPPPPPPPPPRAPSARVPPVPPPPPPPRPPLSPPPPPPLKKLGPSAPLDKNKEAPDAEDKRPKMKQLVWDKISGAMAEQTVWKTATLSSVQMDLEELESLFAVKDTSQYGIPKKTTSARKKDQGVQVLDHKRAHNVGIQLRSLRKPIPKLCQALRDKDETFLNMEVLNVMLNTLPSEEDLLLLKGHQGNSSELAEVEKYYLELSSVSRYEKLIKAFIFKGQYALTYRQIQQDLKLLEQACDQLKSNKSFLKILEMVLAVGNHLNGGSFRGAARGFKLGALLKLMDVKSHNKKTTLLHFVVAELLRTDEKVGKLAEELKSVKIGANLSLERLQSGIKELENGVELISLEVAHSMEGAVSKEELVSRDGQEQQLLEIMTPFYEVAESEVNGLRKLYDTTLTKLKDLAVYYGETLNEERLMELFKTTREFLFMFDQVSIELKESRRREDEALNKRATFLSCPAKGSQPRAVTIKDHNSSTIFQLAPPSPTPKEVHAKPVDLRITSLLRNNNTFPFFKTDPSNIAVVETADDRCLGPTKEDLKSISLLRNDNTDDSQDPHLCTNMCYDSDWSTG